MHLSIPSIWTSRPLPRTAPHDEPSHSPASSEQPIAYDDQRRNPSLMYIGLMKPVIRVGTLTCLLLVGHVACQPNRTAQTPEAAPSVLPITRVVLYQNGVGYFEREGILEGDRLTLQVRPSQINDLLKSLTIVDRSDGRAVSVSLPLEKNADQALSELPEQVRNASGLLDLLTVFRGARVEVRGGFGTVEGRVVGLENISEPPASDETPQPPNWRLTLAQPDGELHVVALAELESLTVLDEALAIGLDRSLDVSLKDGDWKPVSITVRFTGKEDHPLKASYIVEMPRWKPAYRVVLGDKKPLLQGWAVVDNVSGEDWANVKLSLVAGTPVSFIYDLHSSQFVRRTDLTPRGMTAAPPPPVEAGGAAVEENHAEAEELDAMAESSSYYSGVASRDRALRAEKSAAPRPVAQPAPMAAQLQAQFVAETETTQVGSLFRYDLQSPVNIPDRTSTLVNIINERVNAAEVAMFRAEYDGQALPTHPYRAIRLTNDTPFTLEQGPMTLYSAGTFVGEGFIERVEPGATHFVGFSLDSKVSLNSDSSFSEGASKLVRIQNGFITIEVQNQETVKHTFRNQHADPITAFVKLTRRSGWTLTSPIQGLVETPDALWVPADLPAKGTKVLELHWQQKTKRTTNIDTDLTAERLLLTLHNTQLPAQLKSALDEVLAVKREAEQVDRDVRHQQQLRSSLEHDQKRVRDNLDVLWKTKGNAQLQNSLAQKLSKLEQELGLVSGKLVELVEKRAELSKRMADLIGKLEF